MRLLESQPDKKGRSVGGALFSIILHVSIIFLAVFATARAGDRKAEKPKEEKVSFVTVKKEEPPPPEKVEPKPEPPKPKKAAPTPPKVNVPKVVAPAPAQGFKVVPPVINIPTKLPSIDLSKAITNAADFSGKGVAGGSASGVKGGTGKEGDTGKEAGEKQGPYFEFQVEKPVTRLGGGDPEYPSSLRDMGVEGQVLAQFVVGPNGRYEGGTIKILNSSNSAFTAAVKDALPRMRFSAAQIGGRKVAQLVQMPFVFNLKR
jgi:periplasmic protein TonB